MQVCVRAAGQLAGRAWRPVVVLYKGYMHIFTPWGDISWFDDESISGYIGWEIYAWHGTEGVGTTRTLVCTLDKKHENGYEWKMGSKLGGHPFWILQARSAP